MKLVLKLEVIKRFLNKKPGFLPLNFHNEHVFKFERNGFSIWYSIMYGRIDKKFQGERISFVKVADGVPFEYTTIKGVGRNHLTIKIGNNTHTLFHFGATETFQDFSFMNRGRMQNIKDDAFEIFLKKNPNADREPTFQIGKDIKFIYKVCKELNVI